MYRKKYEIHWKDGSVENLEGNFLMDAMSKGDYVGMDIQMIKYFYVLPVPVEEIPMEKEYQLFIMKTKKDNWEPLGRITRDRLTLELVMKTKVYREGSFSGLIVDMSTEKPVDWIWR